MFNMYITHSLQHRQQNRTDECYLAATVQLQWTMQ